MTSSIHIGIIRTSSIGDVILATACLEMIKNLSQNIKVTWFGSNPSLSLIKDSYPDVQTIEFHKKSKSSTAVKSFGHLNFIVDLQRSSYSAIFCYNFRARYKRNTYSVEKHYFDRYLKIIQSNIRGRKRNKPHEVAKYFQQDLMKTCLFNALKREDPSGSYSSTLLQVSPHLNLRESWGIKPAWYKELETKTWLAIAPGASYPAKQTPTEVLTDIISKTIRSIDLNLPKHSKNFGLVFVGDKSDREYAHQIISSLQQKYSPLLNLAGTLTLKETALVLKKSACLLGNDSGLSHIAEALKTPVAVLFGATTQEFGFGPHLDKSRAFSAPLGCRPCSKHGKSPCRYNDMMCYRMLPRKSIHDFLVERICDSLT